MIIYDKDALRCNFIHASTLMMEAQTNYYIAPTVMNKIVGPEFEDEWSAFEYNPNSPHMDPCVRERVMDAVSMYFLGHPWPTYADNADVSMFRTNLEIAILQGPQEE